MKALSVRAPWWLAVLHLGKVVENRDWATNFRGTVLLHASKWWSTQEVADDLEVIRIILQSAPRPTSYPLNLTLRDLKNTGGHIVGSVEIVDCVSHSDSPWFFGKFGFVLRNPIAFATPIPFKGALGFFDVPDSLLTEAQ